jgi:hypothetical protein
VAVPDRVERREGDAGFAVRATATMFVTSSRRSIEATEPTWIG